jgi:hypothetical protein
MQDAVHEHLLADVIEWNAHDGGCDWIDRALV